MIPWQTAVTALSEEPFRPVYVLVGLEHVLAQRFFRRLVERMEHSLSQSVDISRFRFDEEGCEAALFACQTLSLFAETSVVGLENCTAFLPNPKAKHDVSDLESYLANPVDGRILVISVPGEKLDERKKLSKLAKKHVVVDCNTPKEEEALALLRSQASDLGVAIQHDALNELWRRTHSLSTAFNDLAKLWTYTGGAEVRRADVVELVTQPVDDNIFNWIDGVVKGEIRRAFDVLADVQRAGYDSFALYAMIARQLRLMWYAKVLGAKGYSHQQIATKAGAHPYAVKVAMDQVRTVTAKRIEKLLTVVADVEFAVKSGRRDAGQALDYVLLVCSSAK